jgi:hypothetical protein
MGVPSIQLVGGLCLLAFSCFAAWVIGVNHHGTAGACPEGYVGVFRSDGHPACAAYVVEPHK